MSLTKLIASQGKEPTWFLNLKYISILSGGLVKIQISDSYPQSFWFSRSERVSENLHLREVFCSTIYTCNIRESLLGAEVIKEDFLDKGS